MRKKGFHSRRAHAEVCVIRFGMYYSLILMASSLSAQRQWYCSTGCPWSWLNIKCDKTTSTVWNDDISLGYEKSRDRESKETLDRFEQKSSAGEEGGLPAAAGVR